MDGDPVVNHNEGDYVPRSGVDTLALEDDACELTEAQLVSIRAAMFGRNASCSYNMTVGSALLGD